jgi:hypothetical protein
MAVVTSELLDQPRSASIDPGPTYPNGITGSDKLLKRIVFKQASSLHGMQYMVLI